MRKFKAFVRCVDKVIRLYKFIKLRNAKAIIRAKFLTQARKNVKNRSTQRVKMIEDVCEKILTFHPISNLIAYRKFRVRFILAAFYSEDAEESVDS